MNERHIRTTEQIADLYDRINARWFDGQLTRPEIIMQGTSRIWCHYTLHDAFSGERAGKRILRATRGSASSDLLELVEMLAHEMIHQFNNEIRNVQDTSSAGGRYHNRFFAEECKKHGLTAWKTNWNGYSRTVASQEMRDWIRASEENPTDHKRGQRKECQQGRGAERSV